jgi:polyhydroxybutyrate depolymerase
MHWRSIPCLALSLSCACVDAKSSAEADETGGSSDESTSSESGTDSTSTDSTDTTDTTDTGDPVHCEGIAGLAAGNHERSLDHDGLTRAYTIHVPAGLDSQQPAPLLLNMHGYLSNPIQQAQWSEMNETAGPRGWITVYPTGTNNSWNAGLCCGQAVSDGVDDVGFLLAVVESVASELCIDPDRVHATGMSNGGYISHRLACEAADVFASVAPVAGALGIADCAPTRPISVLAFHGVQDPLVSYASDQQSMQAWAVVDGCDSNSEQIDFDGGDHRIWSGCNDDVAVEFYTLDPMGHCWPSGWDVYCFAFLGPQSNAVDANTLMLDFFDAHPRP